MRLDFNSSEAYRCRSLEELDSLADMLNELKDGMSGKVAWYLERYRESFDIPRLCRALAAPDNASMGAMRENGMWGEVEKSVVESREKAREILRSVRHMMPQFPGGKDPRGPAYEVYRDVSELGIYMKMHLVVGKLKSRLEEDRRNFDFYLSQFQQAGKSPGRPEEPIQGNPFEEVMEVMKRGALIVRFKYVSDAGSSPEEKVVSYHLLKEGRPPLLAVHVQGDPEFSGTKLWGQDDGRISMRSGYLGRTIRWGRKECALESMGLRYRDSYFY